MKNLFILLIPTLLIIFFSCDKNETVETENVKFILDSKSVDGKVKGFRFESKQIIDYPNSNGVKPDFTVLAQVKSAGLIIGPYLSNPDMKNTFVLTKEFSNLDSAKLFYSTYDYSNDSTFEVMALDVKPYQIWTIKTENELRGKILILKTLGAEIDSTPYAEMEFLADKIK
ncbi:hypothetical protein [Saccharicrinis sp. FJH54]|uniref:hypothetical protein n=1 Tax=Saccharicrinis sp. FJH54 TaxID=3344665 RepID=UPI0035D4F49A